MGKALVQIRDGIDKIYGELADSSDGGVLSVARILSAVREELATDIEKHQADLVDNSLERLIHEVGRRRGRRLSTDDLGDLFDGYKRIPRTLLVRAGARKSIAKMTIDELESYLKDRTPKSFVNDHSELKRLISDCRKFAESDEDTFEVMLRRQAKAKSVLE